MTAGPRRALLAPMRRSLGPAMLAFLLALPVRAEVLLDMEGRFGRILVDEVGGLRTLSLGDPPTPQSAMKVGDPSHLEFEYTRLAMAGLLYVPEPRKVLVIGLGGGSMPRFLRWLYPQADIESVEIDPDVVQAARDFFGVKDDAHTKVHLADGRAFVEHAKGTWDLVFLDAYAPDYIPPMLATAEFFEAVRQHLAPGGALVSNVWGPPSPRFGSIRRTHVEVFATVVELAGQVDQNHLFVALPREAPCDKDVLVVRAALPFGAHAMPFDFADVVRRTLVGKVSRTTPGTVLRDASPRPALRAVP